MALNFTRRRQTIHWVWDLAHPALKSDTDYVVRVYTLNAIDHENLAIFLGPNAHTNALEYIDMWKELNL